MRTGSKVSTGLPVCSTNDIPRVAMGKAAGRGDQGPRLSQRANNITRVLNAQGRKYETLLGIARRETVFDRIEILLELFYVAWLRDLLCVLGEAFRCLRKISIHRASISTVPPISLASRNPVCVFSQNSDSAPPVH